MSPNQRTVRITTSATTVVIPTTCVVAAIVINCSDAGATWTLKIQNGESPAKVLISAFELLVPTDGRPNVTHQFEQPILMTDGVKVVTAGTPGVVDVWVTVFQ